MKENDDLTKILDLTFRISTSTEDNEEQDEDNYSKCIFAIAANHAAAFVYFLSKEENFDINHYIDFITTDAILNTRKLALERKEYFKPIMLVLTDFDVFDKKEPLYRFKEMVTQDTNIKVSLPFEMVFVNTLNQDENTELGRLMHDFYETDPDKMYNQDIADMIREDLKNNS